MCVSQKIILNTVWGLVGGQSKSGWENELPRKINFISPHLTILLFVSNSFFFPISKSCRYDIGTFHHTIFKNWLKMDQRPRCKSYNYKTRRRKQRESFMTLDLATKSGTRYQKQQIKKIDWTTSKFKAFMPQRTWSTEWKGHPQNGRKYLQITYLTRG